MIGRPPGYVHSAEVRAKISAGVQAARVQGYGLRVPVRNYCPPEHLTSLYWDLRKRFGWKEAKRLIEDHIRCKAAQAVAQEAYLKGKRYGQG